MKYYNFKVGVKNDVEVRTYALVKETDMEYISYDNFLRVNHFTNIIENDDFIPMVFNKESSMILRENQFDITEMEDVFEILYECLFLQGGKNEKSVNY